MPKSISSISYTGPKTKIHKTLSGIFGKPASHVIRDFKTHFGGHGNNNVDLSHFGDGDVGVTFSGHGVSDADGTITTGPSGKPELRDARIYSDNTRPGQSVNLIRALGNAGFHKLHFHGEYSALPGGPKGYHTGAVTWAKLGADGKLPHDESDSIHKDFQDLIPRGVRTIQGLMNHREGGMNAWRQVVDRMRTHPVFGPIGHVPMSLNLKNPEVEEKLNHIQGLMKKRGLSIPHSTMMANLMEWDKLVCLATGHDPEIKMMNFHGYIARK
jgi:hypothetical protein